MLEARQPELLVADVVPSRGNLMIVGGYGSGKTEVSVNLALNLARSGRAVRIIDLDIVNPYFRCREARLSLEAAGIEVIAPPGALGSADLPIILPRIAALFCEESDVLNLFDVGGDDMGARVLSSFHNTLGKGNYHLWQVINGKRPFTQTPQGCRTMREAIERTSRAVVSGLLLNTHLMEETTPEIINDGWLMARETARAQGLPITLVAAMEHFAGHPSLEKITAPILWMRRVMLPPWKVTAMQPTSKAAFTSRPIGKPGPILAGGFPRRQSWEEL